MDMTINTPSLNATSTLTSSDHPCFDEEARLRTARVHLPVAPRCNVQCNYCNRKFDCVSESRPGVSSAVLNPEQAADYVDRVRLEVPNLAVVGIAGPGDPFANAEKTLETFRLVRQRHPDLLLCVSSNGLEVPPHLDAIAELGVSHVTITLNTVDPNVAGRVYRWVRDGRRVLRGAEAGRFILERQLESITGLKERGITVKINTILVPGVTLDGISEVARLAADLGVDTMNNSPLFPVEGTRFGDLPAPTPTEIATARRASEVHLPQMAHCQRCRADAVGLLGADHDLEAIDRLLAAKSPTKQRPYIAVCSQGEYMINEQLGEATELLIYRYSPATGGGSPQLVERRRVPPPGGGAGRWAMLAGLIGDCQALICEQIGTTPRQVLTGAGVHVYEADGRIFDALTDVFSGGKPRNLLPSRDCATSCSGPRSGCA